MSNQADETLKTLTNWLASPDFVKKLEATKSKAAQDEVITELTKLKGEIDARIKAAEDTRSITTKAFDEVVQALRQGCSECYENEYMVERFTNALKALGKTRYEDPKLQAMHDAETVELAAEKAQREKDNARLSAKKPK